MYTLKNAEEGDLHDCTVSSYKGVYIYLITKNGMSHLNMSQLKQLKKIFLTLCDKLHDKASFTKHQLFKKGSYSS